MSKAKIQIEIDEEQFKELVENEIKDLPKEEVQKIILEAIKSYLYHDDIQEIQEVKSVYNDSIEPAKIIRKPNYDKLNAFLIRKDSSYYTSTRNSEPSELFISLLNDCDFSGLQEIVDDMIKDLKENYHDILVEAISKKIAASFINDYNFKSELADIVNTVLNQRNNN